MFFKKCSIKFAFCEKCHGMWFKVADLNEIVRAGQNQPLPVQKDESTVFLKYRNQDANCPEDGKTPMIRKMLCGVEIDICKKHEGIWLDGGEIERMKPEQINITRLFENLKQEELTLKIEDEDKFAVILQLIITIAFELFKVK
ncbi:zf-TFIIB domain-containing protein [Candidatus Riflebacteria bacterium]